MKNIIILITLVILSIPKLKAQDTIPNYYCDCIDTNEIIGNNITNWEYQATWTYSEDVEESYKNRNRKKKK